MEKASLRREEKWHIVRLNLLVVLTLAWLVVEADTVELTARTAGADDENIEDVVIANVALLWFVIGVVELPWTIRRERNHHSLSHERYDLDCNIS